MTSSVLDSLLARVVESGLLDEPAVSDGVVRGRAEIDAAGTTVTVAVDAELEDQDADDIDVELLVDAVSRILAITDSRWRAIIEEIVSDIEDAVDDEPVIEQIDLRDDLEAASVVVFADAVQVGFRAPKQFPDSRILVQLDEDHEVEGVEVSD